MERTRLYNTSTGKWEYVTIRYVRMPWQGAWTGLRWLFRYARRHSALFPSHPTEYDFDPETLGMRDPKRERKQRRRERRDRMLAKAANALNAMVKMQKHIG